MKENCVSIIIPCYNGELFLERHFNSILRQTYKNLQIIFVDDGSVDSTKELAENYQEKFVENEMEFIYLYQENRGQASAVNRGLPYVTGEYFMWIDCDDFLESEHVQKKIEYLKQHNELDMVMCQGNVYDEKDLTKIIDILGKENAVGTLFEDILFAYRSCQCGLFMIRTKALFKALPDKKIYESKVGQNMQILLPVSLKNRIGYLPDKLYNYVVRSDSHSHSFVGGIQWKERLDTLEDMKQQVVKSLNISEEYRSKLLQMLALQMLVMRIGKIDDEIIYSNRTYVEDVFQKFLEITGVKEKIGKREFAVWGRCQPTKIITNFLEEFTNLKVQVIVESNREKVGIIWNNRNVIHKNEIDSQKMFLYIPLRYHKEVVEWLENKNFLPGIDYSYPAYELRKSVESGKNACL